MFNPKFPATEALFKRSDSQSNWASDLKTVRPLLAEMTGLVPVGVVVTHPVPSSPGYLDVQLTIGFGMDRSELEVPDLNPEVGTAERVHRDMARERIQVTAAKLRRLADEIDRYADNFEEQADKGLTGNVASAIVHEVMWGVANLELDMLVTAQNRIADARATDDHRKALKP